MYFEKQKLAKLLQLLLILANAYLTFPIDFALEECLYQLKEQ